MNERIKQLADKSTTIEYGVDNGFDRVTFDKEKFAELIVRDCTNIVLHYTDVDEGVAVAKKHFGVK